MKDLRGKNAVVTGASSGIGQATAVEFGREGMNVVLAARREAEMEEAAARIRALGVKALVKKTDVSKKDEVNDLINFAIRELGGIDVLMNNAGVVRVGEMRDLSIEEDWEWIVGINFWGVVYGCHYVLPHMIGRRSGHIINVSSGAGLLTSPGSGCYCATKFAVVGMTEVLRAEVARLGIGVTLVCPAFVKTPIFEVTKTKGLRQFDMTKAIKYWGQRPETTAKLIVKGIKKNTGLLIPTIDGKLLYSFKRFFPGLYQAAGPLVARQFGKLREEG